MLEAMITGAWERLLNKFFGRGAGKIWSGFDGVYFRALVEGQGCGWWKKRATLREKKSRHS